VDLAGTHDGSIRGRYGVCEQSGLVQWDVVRDLRHTGGLRNVVLSPCAVVGKSHEVQIQTVREGTAAALATLETRATGGWDDAVTLLPTDDARTELDDGSGCLMALSHYWQSCRERTANETQVRMANTAVSDLDKHLTGSRVRDRDIFEGDRPICGVETFSKHGFCHR